jgi:hypothetical protein
MKYISGSIRRGDEERKENDFNRVHKEKKAT